VREKTVVGDAGTFLYRRNDCSQEFVCERCLNPKIAKIVVQWTDQAGRRKTICNGCYGRLQSSEA